MKNITLLFFLTALVIPALAQLSPQPVSIPMRDGKNLAGHLYLPNQADTFPTILIQTPYNKNFYQFTGLPLGVGSNLAASPYAFLIVDWRCFYGSLLACALDVNRGEDGYDVVEWIAAQPWSDGKVGTWGPSALGNIQFQTAREQPPHLVCAVPVVASPQTHYLQYFPGGSATVSHLQTLGLLFGAGIDNIVANPYYSIIWQLVENSTMYPEQIEVPMLLIGGWFDHNIDIDAVLFDTLRAASGMDVRDKHRFLVGPWVHGGTGQASVGTAVQGELNYPEAAHWNDTLALQFFDHYLRGIGNGWENTPFVRYFQMGDNEWKEAEVWPPAESKYRKYYLHESREIDQDLPVSPDANLNFEYDPEDPSPTVGGRTLSLSLDQGPYDQANEVESRDDNLLFSTPVLTEDLMVKGQVKVNLFVSSDRPDTDIALRLTEVYPDGRSMLLGETIQRMRFRNGEYRKADEEFMLPGEVYPVTLAFPHIANTFKPGHRLRIIVTSANYPFYNRNMNTGGEMYPDNNLDTLVDPLVATNTIYINADYPSSVEIPVADLGTAVREQDKEPAVGLFPNPSSGKVYLRNLEGPGVVSVFDVMGRLVLEKEFDDGGVEFNIGEGRAGVYFVRISFWDGGSVVKRVIFE